MSESISRRTLAKKGAAGMAALGLASLANTETTRADIEAGLSEPVPAVAQPVLEKALKAMRDRGATRRKHRLDDSSEPGTRYVAREPGR